MHDCPAVLWNVSIIVETLHSDLGGEEIRNRRFRDDPCRSGTPDHQHAIAVLSAAVMRYSLTDLFICISCLSVSILAVAGAGYELGYGPLSRSRMWLVGVPVGVIVYVVLTPPIYRRFRLLPLFLPVCPHCRRLPDGYHVLVDLWPRTLVACGHCERSIELWSRRPAPSDVSKTVPSLLLSWPHSIGRWRPISSEESA